MSAVHLGDVIPALENPEPTEKKLGRQFGARIDWDYVDQTAGEPTTQEVAPLNREQFRHGVETARAPKWHTGTFRCPLGMRGPVFEKHVYAMTTKWLEEMRRRGFDVSSSTRIDIVPGPYPAKDLATGLSLLGEREMLVRAQFVERQPETVRLELPAGLFEAWRPTPLAKSRGDD